MLVSVSVFVSCFLSHSTWPLNSSPNNILNLGALYLGEDAKDASTPVALQDMAHRFYKEAANDWRKQCRTWDEVYAFAITTFAIYSIFGCFFLPFEWKLVA